MSEIKFDPLINLGLGRHNTNTEIVMGLESFRNEITKKGMSRELYHRVEAAFPGTLSNINHRKLTVNGSDNGKKLAIEAIDLAGAAAGAAGVLGTGGTIAVGAALLGGVAFILYKFYKWIRGGSSKSDKGSSDKATKSATDADGNYTSISSARKLDMENELVKRMFERFGTDGENSRKDGIIRDVLHYGMHFKIPENGLVQLTERCLKHADKPGANVVLGYLLSQRENVRPTWILPAILGDNDFKAAEDYTKWVCELIPLITKPIKDSAELGDRVSTLAIEFQKGIGKSMPNIPSGQGAEASNKAIKDMQPQFNNTVWTGKSKELGQIINEQGEGRTSEKTANTMAAIKSESYSIYQGLPGSTIAETHKPMTDDDISKCISLYCDGLQQRIQLRDSIEVLASTWQKLANDVGKTEFTEDDAKKMAELRAKEDQTNNLNLVFTAISQAVTRHAGFAMQYKRTLDIMSAEIAKATNLFEGEGRKPSGGNDE